MCVAAAVPAGAAADLALPCACAAAALTSSSRVTAAPQPWRAAATVLLAVLASSSGSSCTGSHQQRRLLGLLSVAAGLCLCKPAGLFVGADRLQAAARWTVQGMCQAPQCCAARSLSAGHGRIISAVALCVFVCHSLAVGSLEQCPYLHVVGLNAWLFCDVFLGAFFWCPRDIVLVLLEFLG